MKIINLTKIVLPIAIMSAFMTGCNIQFGSPKETEEASSSNSIVINAYGEEVEYDNFRFFVRPDSTIVITGYTGIDSDVTFPAQIEGISVVRVGADVPYDGYSDGLDSDSQRDTEYVTGMDNVMHISFEEGISAIGANAFKGCEWLTGDLIIPNSVEVIGDSAFYNCLRFDTVTFGDGVKYIGESAFASDSSGYSDTPTYMGLSGQLNLPPLLETIGSSAFKGCGNFTGTLTIPNSVTTIGDSAFYNCAGLTDLVLGTGLSNIPNNCFYGCSGLSNLLLIDRTMKTINSNAFEKCGFTSISVNKPINSITGAPWAFDGSVTWKSEDTILPETEVLFNGIASDMKVIYAKDSYDLSTSSFEELFSVDKNMYEAVSGFSTIEIASNVTPESESAAEGEIAAESEAAQETTASEETSAADISSNTGEANESTRDVSEDTISFVGIPDMFIEVKTKSISNMAQVFSRFKSSLLRNNLTPAQQAKVNGSQIVAYGDYIFFIMLSEPSVELTNQINDISRTPSDNEIKQAKNEVTISNQSYVSAISEYFN